MIANGPFPEYNSDRMPKANREERPMPTTIDLTEQELAELKDYTRQTEDAAAVRSAMNEFLRQARRLKLKELSGQVQMEDNWQSLEKTELDERHGGSGVGAG